MRRFWGLLCLALLVSPTRAEPVSAPPPARPVVLLLVPGAALEDWLSPQTPTLRGLTAEAAVGVMPTRASGPDLADAYRMLASGTRSPSPSAPTLTTALLSAGGGVSVLGGEALQRAFGAPITAPPWRVARTEAPYGIATDLAALARAIRRAVHADSAAPTLIVAEFDDLTRADAYAPVALPRATAMQRRDALRRLDRLIAALEDLGVPLLLVAPQPSAKAAARRERLGPVLLRLPGRPAPRGLLTSPSTRRTPGLIAGTDIAATIASLLGLPPEVSAIGAGRPAVVTAVSGRESGSYLRGRVAAWAAQAREQRLLVGVPWVLGGALLGMCGLLTGQARARRGGAALAVWVASVFASLLLAAPLAPTGARSAGVVYALALGLSLVPPLLTMRLPARSALLGVCAATAALLITDTLLGGPLLGRSPFSYSVIEAARFYGIGNEAAGALLGTALVAAARGRGVGTFVVGALVAATLGLPRFGADFGGLVTAVVAFGTLALGRRRVARQAALLLLLGALVIGGILVWEATRGAGTRTHIGQAVDAARTRGGAALTEIAARKAAMGARLLVTSPWTALFAAEIAICLWLRRRRPALSESDKAAVTAVGVAALVALVINDSGVVAAAACLLYAAPLLALAKTEGG